MSGGEEFCRKNHEVGSDHISFQMPIRHPSGDGQEALGHTSGNVGLGSQST